MGNCASRESTHPPPPPPHTQTMKIAQVPICARDMFETFLSPQPRRERQKKNPLFLLLRLVGGRERGPRLYANTTTTYERERFAQKRHFFWAATATHPLPSMLIFLRWETGEGREGHGHASPFFLSPPPTVRSQREAEEGKRGEGEIRCVDGSPSSSARRRRRRVFYLLCMRFDKYLK